MRLRKEVGRKASAFKNTAMSEGGRKDVGRKRRKDWMLSVSEGPRYSHDSDQNLVVVFFVWCLIRTASLTCLRKGDMGSCWGSRKVYTKRCQISHALLVKSRTMRPAFQRLNMSEGKSEGCRKEQLATLPLELQWTIPVISEYFFFKIITQTSFKVVFFRLGTFESMQQ